MYIPVGEKPRTNGTRGIKVKLDLPTRAIWPDASIPISFSGCCKYITDLHSIELNIADHIPYRR